MIGIFITARLGSKRLPGKQLLEVCGRPIMDYLLLRIRHEFQEELKLGSIRIIITTADEPINRKFEEIYSNQPIDVFYGSPRNLPLRHLQAAQSFGVDRIVCVEADDVFCSTSAMRQVYQSMLEGNGIVRTTGLPLGMNNMGYQTRFLENAIGLNPPEILETGWTTIFNDSEVTEINYDVSYPPELRFTMDYQEDFDFFSRIIEKFLSNIESIPDESIISYALSDNLYRMNSHLTEQYWTNFREEQKDGENSITNVDTQ
ncbi:MAG: hypothetical protein RH862_14840 [Leptospiraceae bacterium]